MTLSGSAILGQTANLSFCLLTPLCSHLCIIIVHLAGETVRAGQGYSISMTVYKEYWDTWVYVPCINGIGSCTFDDVCSLLYKSPRTACPLSEWYLFVRFVCACTRESILSDVECHSVVFPGGSLVPVPWLLAAMSCLRLASECFCKTLR